MHYSVKIVNSDFEIVFVAGKTAEIRPRGKPIVELAVVGVAFAR